MCRLVATYLERDGMKEFLKDAWLYVVYGVTMGSTSSLIGVGRLDSLVLSSTALVLLALVNEGTKRRARGDRRD